MAIKDYIPRVFKQAANPKGFVNRNTSPFVFINADEKDASLNGPRKYTTFRNMAANDPTVSAGVGLYQDLFNLAKWNFLPGDNTTEGERFAALARSILIEDPVTSFDDIVLHAAMYRFYGFSLQNWFYRQHAEGHITVGDVQVRPQNTVEEFRKDSGGRVTAVRQRTDTGGDVILPIDECLYLTDNGLTTDPEGTGMFRSLYNRYYILRQFEQISGFGFQKDLRGMLVCEYPLSERRRELESANPNATQQEIETLLQEEVKPMSALINAQAKNPQMGIIIDSDIYETLPDINSTTRLSSKNKQNLRLLDHNGSSLRELNDAIRALQFQQSRIMATDVLMSGENTQGSFALARVQSTTLGKRVSSTLTRVAKGLRKQILTPVWELNGWPLELMPQIVPELLEDLSATDKAEILSKLGSTVFADQDNAPDEVRAEAGLSPRPVGVTPPTTDDPEPEPEE